MENLEKIIIKLEDETYKLEELRDYIEETIKDLGKDYNELTKILETDIKEIDYNVEYNKEQIEDLRDELEEAETRAYNEYISDRMKEYRQMV
jgi:predicted  nucleic acid-binding Zn-ribbon protein